MRGPMTAEEADDYVSEHGTGSPKTKSQLQAQILADMAYEVDQTRSALINQEARATTDASKRELEECIAIQTRRRDALSAGSLALLGTRMPDADAPLSPEDYRPTRAWTPRP